jgi:hypothetical protein
MMIFSNSINREYRGWEMKNVVSHEKGLFEWHGYYGRVVIYQGLGLIE